MTPNTTEELLALAQPVVETPIETEDAALPLNRHQRRAAAAKARKEQALATIRRNRFVASRAGGK